MSRELLRALVTVKLGIGMRKVNLKALDEAYSIAFPTGTPLNVRKRKQAIITSSRMGIEPFFL